MRHPQSLSGETQDPTLTPPLSLARDHYRLSRVAVRALNQKVGVSGRIIQCNEGQSNQTRLRVLHRDRSTIVLDTREREGVCAGTRRIIHSNLNSTLSLAQELVDECLVFVVNSHSAFNHSTTKLKLLSRVTTNNEGGSKRVGHGEVERGDDGNT